MTKMRFFILIIATFTINIFSQVFVNGIIHEDTEWTKMNSPYILTGDLLVEHGAILRIEAGTEVQILEDTSPENSIGIPQIDAADSQMISIKINGGLMCLGDMDNRVTFKPKKPAGTSPIGWYGIVLDGVNEVYSEIGHMDISGAVYGFRLKRCKPEIYNNVISFCNTGIYCDSVSMPFIRNNTIVNNIVAGIFITKSNPKIISNIIAFSNNYLIWCDGVSEVKASYNCIFGGKDGNLVDCSYDIGNIVKTNNRGDSCDIYYNIFKDPIFSGTTACSLAVENDLNTPTDSSSIKDIIIAKITHSKLLDKQAKKMMERKSRGKYWPSKYSPCIDAGKPKNKYDDFNGSQNDIGAYGGPGSRIE